MKFFIPDLPEQPDEAEARWVYYCQKSGAPTDSKRVFKMAYLHDGDKYEVEVGETRVAFARKTGPKGGYIKNAGHSKVGRRTGSMISAIIDSGNVISVWSYGSGADFGGWANPSFVGHNEVESIEYFE